jgi:hypothetical protein
MGPKTLRDIREQLRSALEATGDDPIHRLEQLMADPQYQGASGKSEVLQSLRRFLEATGREKRRTRRVGTKKQVGNGCDSIAPAEQEVW